MGTSCGEMITKLDLQSINTEFDFYWMPHTSGLVLHVNKA